MIQNDSAFQNGESGAGFGGTGGGPPQAKSECLNGGYVGCIVSTVQ